MGFLNSIFSTQEKLPTSWIPLEDLSMIDTLIKDSFNKTVVIYKHSTTCGLSQMKKSKMEEDWDFSPDDMDFYYLDLLRKRPISNDIESRFKVLHESPQLLMIKDGKVVFHTSHHKVTVATIKSELADHK